jgi:hypothetical protein
MKFLQRLKRWSAVERKRKNKIELSTEKIYNERADHLFADPHLLVSPGRWGSFFVSIYSERLKT